MGGSNRLETDKTWHVRKCYQQTTKVTASMERVNWPFFFNLKKNNMHSRSLFSFDKMLKLMLYVPLNNFSVKPGCYSDLHQY